MHKPLLIVIAGPNGSGKTSVTKQIIHHEWSALVLQQLTLHALLEES